MAALDPGLAIDRAALTRSSLLPLGGRRGDAFLIGLRTDLGTVEVVTPAATSGFSYTIPLREPSVKLHWSGSGNVAQPLDRSTPGFHHLGDLTIRVRRLDPTMDPTAPRSDAAALEARYTSFSTVVASAPHPADSGADGGLVASRDGSSASMDVTTQLRPRCAFQCHTQIPPSSLPPLNTNAARL